MVRKVILFLSVAIALGLAVFGCASESGNSEDGDLDAGDSDLDTETESDTEGVFIIDTDFYKDNLPPSADPPGDLSVSQVPLLVSIGFDDNAYSGLENSGTTGGVTWVADLFRNLTNQDGTQARVSFFVNSTYIETKEVNSPTFVKRAWRALLDDGHEIGNHTHSHKHGKTFLRKQWEEEIQTCTDWLAKPFDPNENETTPDETKGIGLEPSQVFGFRTPFLEYNHKVFEALMELKLLYDCSIEDGYQSSQDGTNYLWPYTLNNGSPGNEILVEWGQEPIGSYPGLWEMPVHPVIVPPDDKCEEYGVPEGLREKMHAVQEYFETADGKITGLDYNLWEEFEMNKAEFLATLKYTLDLRLSGNRAPMMFGAHSDIYSDACPDTIVNATLQERQEAMAEFVAYALGKPEVRIVPIKAILDWMRNPQPIAK